MPSRFRGHCLDCKHEWDGLRWWIDCGPIDVRNPETYRCHFCPRCFVDLSVPRQLSRSSWLRWITQNASEMTRSPLVLSACELGVRIDLRALEVISRSPLLFEACERVSRILAAARSRYVPIPIDIGSMPCPDCGDPMTNGCIQSNVLFCPRCKNQSARSIGEHHHEIALVDYFPLKDADVRRMVFYLTELAEHPEDRRSRKMLTWATAESRGALWDRQLDG
jgi:hypothetical protein